MSDLQRTEGLTRRDIIKKGALLGGTVMWVTPVVQTVGMSSALAQTPSDTCVPQSASEYVAEQTLQGKRKDGSDVLLARSNPENALGPSTAGPANAGEEPFYSLGFGGVLVVGFAQPAYVAQGSDVVVIETTNTPYPLESARIDVSADGSSWVNGVGTATNAGDGTSLVDLSGVGLVYIQYVRLTDTTDSSIHNNVADGFDVNAVEIACSQNGAAA